MKIKLFTHTDLDGVGCAIVAKASLEDACVEYCDYDNINNKVNEFLESPALEAFDIIFITDISVNGDVADAIKSCSKPVYLLDHHSTAEWLNKYEWAFVSIEYDGRLQSGCNLFYEKLCAHMLIDSSDVLDQFVEAVRRYDTWEWTKLPNSQLSKDLHDVLGIIGIDEFAIVYTDIVHYAIAAGDKFDIISEHKDLLKYFKIKNDNYIKSKLEEAKVITDEFENKCAFVVSSDFATTSELGNAMCNQFECDYAAVYYGTGTSLRSIGDFDVSKIAESYGGGGRCNTAGMPPALSYITKYAHEAQMCSTRKRKGK